MNLRQKMAVLYNKYHWSLRKIAKKCNISHEKVRTILGPDIVRPKENKNISKARVLKLYEKLQSYQGVADRLDVSRQYIFMVVNDPKNKKKRTRAK